MGSKGIYLSKSTLIFCGLAVLALTLLVGILCGILPECTNDPEPIIGTIIPTDPTEPPSTTQRPKELWEELRLPTSLKPHHYELYIKTDITNRMFNGSVDILISCEETTNYIILHSKMLDIVPGSATLSSVGSTEVPEIQDLWLYEENQYMVVELGSELVKGGMYIFSLQFGAALKEDLIGYYLSSYKSGSETRYLATTFFAPTDARKAFPCFDEPAMKANFTLTMDYEAQFTAIANMNDEVNENLPDGWKRTKFAMSVPMSTYLVCYVVSDFTFKDGTTKNGVYMRLWARPDAIDNVDYALQIGLEQLDFYDDYFATKFPLPKMDMIALPDFTAGGMENWGLITYRETALLYEEGVSSASNKQRVCAIVAHELAHQWFGNLVTVEWWDDTWLNEGFASYVEYLGMNYSEPDWGMLGQFVARDLQGVLVTDSLATSRPISIPVLTPEEINQQFDSISYNKGASILRMLSFIIGESTFQKGLKNYLDFYKYDNAVNDDLWVFLTEAAREDGQDIDVKQIMDTWTLQMGYPSVYVEREYRGDSQCRLTADQTRFLIDPKANTTTEYDDLGYRWYVPITYFGGAFDSPDKIYWLEPDVDFRMALHPFEDDQWLLVNYDERGYYRVNYDATNWDLLEKQLITDHTAMSIASRSALLSDAFNLARSGALNQTVALDQTLYLVNEREYVPWLTVSSVTGYIDLMISRSAAYGSFKKYMARQVSPLYEYVGWSDTGSHLDRLVRSIAISFACGYGNENCTSTAINMYQEWMADPTNNNILPDVRYTVYCTAIAAGGQDEWYFALDQYQTTTSSTEQSNLRSAMACANEPWILSTYLEYTKNPDLIRSQDAVSVITSVASNTVGAPLAWDYFRGNWDYLREVYGDTVFTFADLVEGVTRHFNTEFHLQELKDFMAENPDQGTASRQFTQMVEAAQANIRWMENNYDAVEKWFREAVSS